ncbi:MAG TPA: SUF system NifU family Fe-S cluster assembly protein [Patescibacteria group bacterium]|nr:SUF system NifU family Fe-S cluster assembly protein [Patescibacteria group bacterium]
MSDLYRDLILDHWKNPHNFGKLKKPTVEIKEANPLCGDDIELQIVVKKEKITDVKFSGEGCALSQAGASILTDILKGKSLSQVKRITEEKFLKILGIRPNPARLKCALLSFSALQKALKQVKFALK